MKRLPAMLNYPTFNMLYTDSSIQPSIKPPKEQNSAILGSIGVFTCLYISFACNPFEWTDSLNFYGK